MSIPPKPLFRVTPCCVENGTSAEINLDGILASGTGVYTYNGASDLPIPGTDVTLVPGECYYIIALGTLGDVTEVPLADLTFITADRCEEAVGCPTCDPPGTFYIKAESCCGGDPIFFKGEGYEGGTVTEQKEPTSGSLSGQWQSPSPSIPQFSILDFNGVYLFDGPGIVEGLTIGQCYTFSYNTVEDASSEVTPSEYLALDYPPYISELTFISKDDCDADANGDGEKDCPACEEICYRLTSCTGITINTTADLSAYVGTFIEINELPGTFLVQVNEGLCENPIPVITYSGPAPADCPCICYEVLDYEGAISYIDCDGVSQVTYGPAKFCAIAPPFIRGKEGIDYTLVTGIDCVDGECVDECFLLTNCEPSKYPDQDPLLYSTLQSLSQYANGDSVVVLAGYEGCWTVTITTPCDCPVDLTVIRDYETCEECVGITAYKLSNCEKINEVVYSTQDLSAYVGQVLKDDCNCWTVEEIDYQPPSEVTIVDPILYTDCTSCLTTYYQLDNCDPSGEPLQLITATDLSENLNQVVKIEGCTDCFIVSEYTTEAEPTNTQDVTVSEAFIDCPSCRTITPRCSTVFNNSTEDRTFTFINANGDEEETDLVKSGCSSLRYCVQYWDEPDTFIYNFYGDCTVFERDDTPASGDCNCLDVLINNQTTYKAVFLGQLFNGEKVFEFTIGVTKYYIWATGVGGGWQITPIVGDTNNSLGTIKNGVFTCPVAISDPAGWTSFGTLPGGGPVASIITTEGDCPTVTIKDGFCVQYFPNDRKVRPGYNTPICSADKYDKITCKFADIAYKSVLELRYGISNCCPEEDEKWLIKKELIELQALTDPNYTCDPLTDCCGKQTSQCSCNS